METAINDAIKALAQKAKDAQPHEALHLSQAALNLAQVAATLANTKKHLS